MVWIDRYLMKFNKELLHNLLSHKLLLFNFLFTTTTQTIREMIPPNTTITMITITIISIMTLDLDVELIPVIISE